MPSTKSRCGRTDLRDGGVSRMRSKRCTIAPAVRAAAAPISLFPAAIVLGAIACTPSPVAAEQQRLAALAYPMAIERRQPAEPKELASSNVRIWHTVPVQSGTEGFCAFTMVPTLVERRHSCMWLCEEISARDLQRSAQWEP